MFQHATRSLWPTAGVILTALYILWFVILRFVILHWRPLWVLSWNDALERYEDLQLPDWLGPVTKFARHFLILIGLFRYHRRVLDACVARYIEKCRGNFAKLPTVADREVHVSIPVHYNGQLVGDREELSGKTFRAEFGDTSGRRCLLISGEGGSGKTSLACQLGKWAMEEDEAKRLAPHRMLAILLEEELDDATVPEDQRFTEAARGKLQSLISVEEPIPQGFFEALLRQGRILVIVDHFSEMSEGTRNQIRPLRPGFPAAALVVTSRIDLLGHVPKSTLRTIRIDGKRLSAFMDAYLTQHGKRTLFDDEEYFDLCRRLSRMVGVRHDHSAAGHTLRRSNDCL